MSDEPTALGEPLPLMSEDEIIVKARAVITGLYMMADLNDPDWRASLALMLSAYEGKFPPNASLLWLVPMGPHAHGHWLNGRVPGCTFQAEIVPLEDVEAFLNQVQTFWRALHPEVPPVPQSGP